MTNQNVLKFIMIGVSIIIFQATYAQRPEGKKNESHKQTETTWVKESNVKQTTVNIFFPEFNVYFNVSKNVYIYQKGDSWKESPKPPKNMKNVDLKNARKVEMDKRTDNPHSENNDHKKQYGPKDKNESNHSPKRK